MKTTIDLPDDLLIQVKVRAARERKTLKQIIEGALRRELNRNEQEHGCSRHTIRWVTVAGGLPAKIDVADRETWQELMSRPL